MPAKLGDITVGVAADLTGLSRGLKESADMLRAFASNAPRLAGSTVRDALSFATGDLLAGGFRTITRDLTSTVRESINLASAWEKSEVSFSVLLGSMEKAKSLMQDMRRFAAESPLGMADTVAEATKLLAAGVTQAQIVPTLGVLSDLTLGDKEKFGRAALAYSQVKAAGVLHGDDLRQLNNLGIPLVAEIAKVKGVEQAGVKALIESGAVSFADLQRAMKNLTSEGGLFFRMTEKGAATTAGMFERLGDSVDELKREFGKAVIEESGLNEAMRDGARFADEMRASVDDLRPAIRFTSDLLKGAAQVVGEGLRNGPLFVRALADGIREGNPRIGQMIDLLDRGVSALKNFRVNPREVVRTALSVGRAFGETFDHLLDDLGGGLQGLYERHVKPITDEIKSAADAWKAVKDFAAAPFRFGEQIGRTAAQMWAVQSGEKISEELYMFRKRDDLKAVMREARGAQERATGVGVGLMGLGGVGAVAGGGLGDLTFRIDDAMTELQKAKELFDVTTYRAKWTAKVSDAEQYRAMLPGLEKDVYSRAKELDALIRSAGGAGLNDGARAFRDNPTGPLAARQSGWDKFEAKLLGLADDMAARWEGRAADPLAAVLGMGAVTARNVGSKPEFLVDSVKEAMREMGDVRLAPGAELGSQAVAEAYSRLLGASANPQVEQLVKLNDVANQLLAVVGGMAANPQPQPPVIPFPAR